MHGARAARHTPDANAGGCTEDRPGVGLESRLPSATGTPMPPPNDLARRDLAVVWHPCTQMKDHEWLPMIPILRGEGGNR